MTTERPDRAQLYSELESPICDTCHGIDLAYMAFESILELDRAEKAEDVLVFRISRDDLCLLTYAVLEAGEKARALRKQFYAGFGEEV